MPYQGLIIPIPIGDGGLDTRNNKSAVPINKLVKADNVFISKSLVSKEGGTAHANSTALSGNPSVVGGFDYFPDSSTQRSVVATSDGILYKDAGDYAYATQLKTGLGSNKKTVMCEGGAEVSGNDKKLFIFNGFDPVQVLAADGATTSDLSTPPADWTGNVQPVKGCVHNGRLWAILGHNLYGSTVGDHEDFTGTGSQLFPVFPGESDELINMVSALGRLFLFKRPYGIYYLVEPDVTASNWSVKRFTGKIGCCGVDALDSSQNEVVFMSVDAGLHYLSGVQDFGDVKDTDLMALLNLEQFIQSEVNRDRLDRAVVRYYEDKKQIWACYSSSAATANNRIVKLEVSDLANIKPSITRKDGVESLWMAKEPNSSVRKPVSGDDNGFVWKHDQSSRSVNGNAYNAVFQTPFTGFEYYDQGLETRNKNYEALEIQAVPVGDHDIIVDVYVDGDYKQTLFFNMGTAGSALDSFVLDTDRVDGAGVVNKIKRLCCSGRRISFSVSNSGLNQSFEIEKMFCYCNVGAEDLRSA